MADGPTEPLLPPAYQAVHAAHHRLAEAERQLRWRRSVEAEIAVEEERLRALWQQLARERADVAALEARTLRSIRAKLRRSHDADLAAEQADVRAIEAEIALRLDAIDAIDASPGRSTVDGAIEAVEQAREDLDEALASWRAEHVAAGSELGLRLVDLDRLATHRRALRRELHEALDVARLTTAALLRAGRLSGHWMAPVIVNLPEPGRVDAIASVQRWLLELRAELADLAQLEAPAIDGPDIVLPSLNVGPVDVFDDWMVDNRVHISTVSVDATLARVRRVATGLAELADRLDEQIDALEREGRDLLLGHPGIV